MKILANFWILTYILLSICHLLSIIFNLPQFTFYSKPFLLTLLIIYFATQTKSISSNLKYLFLTGLIFSLLGDSLLLFSTNGSKASTFFILGLIAFLITHLCYIFLFKKMLTRQKGILHLKPVLYLPFVLFYFTFIAFLWPGIPKTMTIPVIIYAATIIFMLSTAMNLKDRIKNQHYVLIFSGALLFLISDSLIGINRFQNDFFPFDSFRFWIMLTYLSAQLLLTIGIKNFVLDASKP